MDGVTSITLTLFRDPSDSTSYRQTYSGNFTTSESVDAAADFSPVYSVADSGSRITVSYDDARPVQPQTLNL
jgi:hypothetical protein